jgi:hypothetical protein
MTTYGNVTSYINSIWKLLEAVEIFTAYISKLNMTPNYVLIAGPALFQVD